MLACRSLQSGLFDNTEQFFDCTQQPRPSDPEYVQLSPSSEASTIGSARTPVSGLQNIQYPCIQDGQLRSVLRKEMQPYEGAAQHLSGFPSSHLDPEHDIPGQDSGLGIITDENYFGDLYSSSGADQTAAFGPQHGAVDLSNGPKLASPFDGEVYTPALGWDNAYPTSTLSDGYRQAYSTGPNQGFYTPEHGNTPGSFAVTPGSFTPHNFNYGIGEPEYFKKPMGRHNSNSSTMQQGTMYAYDTPSAEASPYQHWTPQTTTPDWQNTSQYLANPSRVPTFTLDHSACHSADHSPQTMQQHPQVRTIMTVPQRRKPHLRPSLSESCVPRISSPARLRAASMGYFLQAPLYDQYPNNGSVQQLPLPPLPPSLLINTPQLQSTGSILPGTPGSSHRHCRSISGTAQRRKKPSSPPPSDFNHPNMPYLVPIRQDPTFSGDLYTPRYKRRTPNGRWEGWCGYCQPGRWLDLKNSRFWEDKLRNHGICAKTKMRFDEPEQIRWVTTDGTVIPESGLGSENGDPFLDQRKREGLCGVCNTWVGMDGLRTKARDRAVGWWMHAYKCHDHDKVAEQQQAAVS